MTDAPANRKLIFWIVIAILIAILPWIVLATGLTD